MNPLGSQPFGKYVMKKRKNSILLAIWCLLLVNCSLFDSRVEWRAGPYALLWIDGPDEVFVARDLGNGAWAPRVEACVFRVGWDGRYLVTQQHPKGSKTTTNYYIIDAQKDDDAAGADKAVIGPLTEVEFMKKSTELKLPGFSKVLESLK